MTEQNPLLQIRFEIPFDKIAAQHVEPAIDQLLKESREAIAAVVALTESRTYDNTIDALDRGIEGLDYAMSIVGHLESVATDDDLRAAYNAVQPKVAAFYAQLPLDPGLWKALQVYAQTDDAKALDETRARHLKKTVDDFRRHGAELADDAKSRLEALNVELSVATTKFAQNVLDATNAWELVITDETKLAGLPPTAVAAAAESAKSKGVEGWRLTLQEPSYVPVLTYLDDAEIRRQLWTAYGTRAREENRSLLNDILRLRSEKARLLGFDDFADLVLDDRMAKTGAAARTFIDELRDKTQAGFVRENEELLAFRKQLEGPDAQALAPWDVAYYAEKQRKALYEFDSEALRPYFSFEEVMKGAFTVAQRLYGVTIEAETNMPTWHEAVKCFRLVDQDSTKLGAFYVDMHPRETKRGGAWMNGLITGVQTKAGFKPHLGLICGNVSPPVDGKPALLNHREVETIFHEFGHLMHHCLSRVTVRALGGANVAWDFVELPSQIMENWCWEREALDFLARHHETDEPIPAELFAKMTKARTFRAANAMMRQLGFATVDLALHTQYDPARDGDVLDYARTILEAHSAAPLPDDYAMITGFTHLFAHPVGYAAAYYSYKWAEVLDADAFTRFSKEGVFSRDVGQAFRQEILERGDSRDPMALYEAFMGRKPSVEPLLRRSGLLAAAQ